MGRLFFDQSPASKEKLSNFLYGRAKPIPTSGHQKIRYSFQVRLAVRLSRLVYQVEKIVI
jgi:hypothetical protein